MLDDSRCYRRGGACRLTKGWGLLLVGPSNVRQLFSLLKTGVCVQ